MKREVTRCDEMREGYTYLLEHAFEGTDLEWGFVGRWCVVCACRLEASLDLCAEGTDCGEVGRCGDERRREGRRAGVEVVVAWWRRRRRREEEEKEE
jgi:hypothetical protein